MSNVKVNTINDVNGGSNAVLYGVAAPANSMGFRNRIINGDMRIDQRNAGAAISYTAAAQVYLVDRFFGYFQQASKFTIQQNQGSVTRPAGFANYLGFTSSAATTPGSTDLYSFGHKIEGFNIADLGWGTAIAQSITLSFWVRSSLTGTFGGSFFNSGGSRNYVFSYTISAANTWEQKTVIITGDTSGTWLTNNGTGIQMYWNLGSGSSTLGAAGSWGATSFYGPTGATSVVGTSGATFYITGVQLEAGSVASPFERRDYGRELMMCQRYYQKIAGINSLGYALTGTAFITPVAFKVTMRASPSVTLSAGTQYNSAGLNTYFISPDNFGFGTTASASATTGFTDGSAIAVIEL